MPDVIQGVSRSSPGAVDAGRSPGCQSIFNCRELPLWPMVSVLHIHRALKLNVYAAPLPAHGTRCSFGIS